MTRSGDAQRSKLVKQLADGKFHSGEQLGTLLGISRAAVAKHIKALGDLGLDVFSVSGRGYALSAPLELLDEQIISQHLSSGAKPQVLSVTDSTNAYLKVRTGQLAQGEACLAEAQTAGRGRQGKVWLSPFASSLYLSMHWYFAQGYQSLGGLSLAIGVAVSQVLDALGVEGCQLKWPNDIYLSKRKLAGVLIEVEGQMGSGCHAIIGLGLNMRLPPALANAQISQPWIDLAQVCEPLPARNLLAARLLDGLYQCLGQFEAGGLAPFLAQWRARDLYLNQPICLVMGNQQIQGIGKGIDDSGALLLQQGDECKAYYGGEISVRRAC